MQTSPKLSTIGFAEVFGEGPVKWTPGKGQVTITATVQSPDFKFEPITSLHGLEALTQVGEPGGESRVGLYMLPDLTSLDGLAIDWRPDHDIWLYATGITDMSALAGVSELTALNLGGNAALISLAGLEQLTVVREALESSCAKASVAPFAMAS